MWSVKWTPKPGAARISSRRASGVGDVVGSTLNSGADVMPCTVAVQEPVPIGSGPVHGGFAFSVPVATANAGASYAGPRLGLIPSPAHRRRLVARLRRPPGRCCAATHHAWPDPPP